MALPTLVKTWLFNVNQAAGGLGDALLDNMDTLFKIKQALIGFAGGYWTVTSSCGKNGGASLVAGLGDNWLSSADLLWNTVNRSWIVLTNSATGAQLCLDLAFDWASYGGALYAYFSPGGGYATTGLSTSSRPTPPSDEVSIGAGVNYGGFNLAHSSRLHVMMSDDGTCTRVISCISGVAAGLWILDEVRNSVTGWTNPNVCTVTGVYNSLGDWLTYTKFFSGKLVYAHIDAPVSMCMTSESYSPGPIGIVQVTVDLQERTWPICPIGLLCADSIALGRKGELYDMWWGNQIRVTGDTYPNDTSYQFVQFGNLVFPWNGTVPLVA